MNPGNSSLWGLDLDEFRSVDQCADRCEFSKPIVRSALKELYKQGLIEKQTHGGKDFYRDKQMQLNV